MKQINSSDKIFVTVVHMGRTLLTTSLQGAGCIGDVTRSIMSRLDGDTGLMNIYLRNGSQGWSQRLAVRL